MLRNLLRQSLTDSHILRQVWYVPFSHVVM
jgi:hypothetical protein